MSTTTSLEDRVAQKVITHFNALPRNSKPRDLEDGTREWTPISGTVLVKDRNGPDEQLTCVSVGTGSKCLPQAVLSRCQGRVLHDCHAEILAMRGLNCFLLREALGLLERRQQRGHDTETTTESPFLRYCDKDNWDGKTSWPFQIHEDISIHMFSTEAPCGDASMEILMASKPDDEREPWETRNEKEILQGRGYFADLGVVRRKPSRPDAPPTLSKSCTDKLTVKTVTSLLSFPTCLFIAPSESSYLASLVLPAQRYSESACERAFGPSGRMRNLANRNEVSQFAYRPFEVKTVVIPVENLPYSRPKTGKARVGNVSALWIAGALGKAMSAQETLINGVKQGFKQFSTDERRSSVISRLNMILLARTLSDALQAERGHLNCPEFLTITDLSYDACKARHAQNGDLERARMKSLVTNELGGWPRNDGDGDWEILSIP